MKNKGFTLVELMVTIVILLILAVFAIATAFVIWYVHTH